jgi:hypothetical protein
MINNIMFFNGYARVGGAIAARDASNLTISNCVFARNFAYLYNTSIGGGAIYVENSYISVYNTKFTQNTVCDYSLSHILNNISLDSEGLIQDHKDKNNILKQIETDYLKENTSPLVVFFPFISGTPCFMKLSMMSKRVKSNNALILNTESSLLRDFIITIHGMGNKYYMILAT